MLALLSSKDRKEKSAPDTAGALCDMAWGAATPLLVLIVIGALLGSPREDDGRLSWQSRPEVKRDEYCGKRDELAIEKRRLQR